MKAVACPHDSGLRWMLLAGVVAFVPCAAAIGAPVSPAEPSPIIVPLDVTMEDAGWLEATAALARVPEGKLAEPDTASLAAVLKAADEEPAKPAMVNSGTMPAGQLPEQSLQAQIALVSNETDSGSRLGLLAVPPGFSINTPNVAISSGSGALAAAVDAGTMRRTGIGRDQPKGRKRTYKVNGAVVEFEIPVQLNGELVGRVPLKIGADRVVSVQLPELLALLQDRMDPQARDWLASAYSVNSHISFDQVRSAGIDVRYNAANDVLVLATN